MLIAVFLVIFLLSFVVIVKIINKIKRRLIRRREKVKQLLIYQNQYYEHHPYHRSIGFASDEEEQRNRYSLQVLQKNFCHIFGHYIHKKLKIFLISIVSITAAALIILSITFIRYKMIEARIRNFFDQTSNSNKPIEDIDRDAPYSYMTTFFSWDLCKIVNDQFLEDYFLILFSLSLTLFIYFWNSFQIRKSHRYFCKFSRAKLRKCGQNSDNSDDEEEEKSSTIASILASTKSRSLDLAGEKEADCCVRLIDYYLRFKKILNLSRFKRFVFCGLDCQCGIEFPVPMNPFSKRNRFITGIIYAAYTYNILKIFEHLLIGDQTLKLVDHTKSVIKGANFTLSTNLTGFQEKLKGINTDLGSFLKAQERGILMDLLKQICNVFIIGLRYYPVLLCVELKRKSKLCYLLCTIYVTSIFFYYLYMNTFCLLSASTTIKEFQSGMKKSPIMSSQLNNTLFANYFENLGLSNSRSFKSAMRNTTTINPKSTTKIKRELVVLDDPSIASISILPYFNQQSRLSVNSDSESIDQNLTIQQFQELKSNITSNFLTINWKLFFDNFLYEKFVFYAVLCLITLNMIVETILLFIKNMRKKKLDKRKKRKNKECCQCCSCRKEREASASGEPSDNHENDHLNTSPVNAHRHRKNSDSSSDESDCEYSIGKVDHEMKYTKQLLRQNIPKPISFSKYLFEKYIYKLRKDFRYSKQFLNTHIIALILLYYITSLIIRKSKLIMSISSNILLMLISFIFKMNSMKDNSFMLNSKNVLTKLVDSLYDNLSFYIIWACCFTTGIYVIQLMIGIRRYQKNVLNAYKGVYVDIPSPKRFANSKLVSGSLHYR
jgi:hypothetical protein